MHSSFQFDTSIGLVQFLFVYSTTLVLHWPTASVHLNVFVVCGCLVLCVCSVLFPCRVLLALLPVKHQRLSSAAVVRTVAALLHYARAVSITSTVAALLHYALAVPIISTVAAVLHYAHPVSTINSSSGSSKWLKIMHMFYGPTLLLTCWANVVSNMLSKLCISLHWHRQVLSPEL